MAKGKHKDYTTVKLLMQGGQIKSFRQIFEHIAKSVVYKDIGVNYTRFKRLLKHTDEFTIQELILFSSYIECDAKTLIDLAYAQYLDDKASRSRKLK